MSRSSATGECTRAQNSFRPVLVRSRTTPSDIDAEAQVKLLNAELARVRIELRELKWATNAFVRSMI